MYIWKNYNFKTLFIIIYHSDNGNRVTARVDTK